MKAMGKRGGMEAEMEMEGPEEDNSDYVAAAGDILSAMKAGDAESLAEALQNFVRSC